MADWKGVPFFLVLLSAERFSERAIFVGSDSSKTCGSRSSALLFLVTPADHLFADFLVAPFFDTFFFTVFFTLAFFAADLLERGFLAFAFLLADFLCAALLDVDFAITKTYYNCLCNSDTTN